MDLGKCGKKDCGKKIETLADHTYFLGENVTLCGEHGSQFKEMLDRHRQEIKEFLGK